jgi:hypothetical protein
MELYHLCRTSRLLWSIAEPRLFERHFRHSEQAQMMDIRSILCHPRFDLLINTLSLRLTRELGQANSCGMIRLRDSREIPCSCDKLDEELGTVLNSLLNLKALRLHCTCCKGSLHERHRYLATLQTTVLQKVTFSCTCSIMDEKRVVKYLGASCMSSVATLRWYSRGEVSLSGYLQEGLSSSNILPKLRNIYHDGSKLNHLLLRHRPIQKVSSICLDSSGGPLYEDLMNKRGVLTHIHVQAQLVAKPLLDAIAADPLPFRNLRHLGTFRLTSSTCLVSLFLMIIRQSNPFEGSMQSTTCNA